MRTRPFRSVLTSTLALFVGGAMSSAAQDLTVWSIAYSSGAQIEALEKLAADFEEQHPGTNVEIVRRGTDEHKTALRIAAGADAGPDIYFSWAGLGLGGEYVKAGLSLPLDEYYDQYGWSDQLTGPSLAFADRFAEGKHGVPFRFSGQGVYYNKSLYEQAGIEGEPESYEELVAAAEKLKEAGIPAFTFGGTVNWHLMRLMDVVLETKCGAETHDALKAMEASWSEEPCATEAFEDLQMWAQNYVLSPFMGIDQAQSFNLFVGERAAMMLEGDWLVTQLNEVTDLENFGMFPFPTGTGRLYGFAEYQYISTKTDHPDLAAEFLNYFVSDAFQQEIVGAFGAVSVNSNVEYGDDRPELHHEWVEIFRNYDQLFVNGDQAFPLAVTTEYFRVINNVATGDMEPSEAGETLQLFIDNQ